MYELLIDSKQIRKNQKHKVLLDDYYLSVKKKNNLINSDWDNYFNRFEDYKKIKKLQKKLFDYLVKKIEKYHRLKFNKIYWKIILIPWINKLIPHLFHYWKLTNKIDKKNFTPKVYNYHDKDFIIDSFSEINIYNNIHYNRWIISKILQFKYNFKTKNKKIHFKKKINLKKKTTNTIILKLFSLFKKLFNKTEIFIKGTQIGFFNYFLLSIKLKQIPALWIEDENYEKNKTNIQSRILFFDNDKKINLFNFIKKNLIYLIPKNYLENYNSINTSVKNLYWPKKANLILCSTAYDSEDYFKFWVANQKFFNNSKYIIFQHGGLMGTEKLHNNLETQLSICDKFISWGWTGRNSKIIPFYSNIASKKIDINYKINEKIYFCQKIYPNYFNHIYGGPITMNKKIDNLKIFRVLLKSINKGIRKNVILRYQQNLAEESNYFKKSIKSKIQSSYKTNFIDEIKKARIVIHERDSTTFLQTISLNIPTILILEKKYSLRLSNKAKKYYKQLEKNKIIFTDAKKATVFLNKHFKNIEKWWEKKHTQKARSNFCKNFVKKSENLITDLHKLIKKIS